MADAYVIECEGITAGIAVPERSGFRFHASDPVCNALDRKPFSSLAAIKRAIRDRLAGTRTTRAA